MWCNSNLLLFRYIYMKKKEDMKFSSLLKNIIVENSRLEFLVKKFTEPREKGGKKLPPILKKEELLELIKGDPTSVVSESGNVKKVGKYTQWLIKQFLTLTPQDIEYGQRGYDDAVKRLRELFFEDLYKTTEDLKKFEKFKNRLPENLRDISKLTINTLFDNVKDFSLEKTKGTKEEKEKAAQTFEYPGSELIFDGQNWVVTKITDTGQLGKDAACFFGGYNEETRWCTSAPGLSWFDRYIKTGPLYQIFKKGGEVSDKTGLPKERYQFHFPESQFMDINDRQINLVKFLQNNPELKEVFKPEFAKSLTTGQKGKRVVLNYPSDSASKFVVLYGFDEFFDSLPDDLERFEFTKGSSRYGGDEDVNVDLKIPSSIGRFKNLDALHLEDVIEELPKEISNLKNLQFLSLPNNKNLKELPDFIADLPNLQIVNIGNSNPNMKIGQKVLDKANDESNDFFLLK